MFDPQQHLISLVRRVKNKETGGWDIRRDEYLEVKWRVVMFREKFPHGIIETTEVHVDLDKGYARYQARGQDGEGGSATGYGTETAADFADFCERAETRALSRALAVLGFGTQFVGQDLTEGEHVADAPVTNGHSDTPAAAPPSTNGKDRPTEADITALTTLAIVECGEDAEVFGQRLRTIMKLKPSASVAPKLLTQTMTMAQYQEAMAYYQRLQAQLTRSTEVVDGTPFQNPSVSEPAPLPTEEKPSAVPFESSSAPASDRAEVPTAMDGAGPQDPPPAERYATREQVASLKRLAARVSAEASEDLADVMDHSPKGLLMDVYQRIERRLQGRLNGKPAASVA
jgi:hypothetical protein